MEERGADGATGATQQIPERESLTIEFKSDLDRLPDRELVLAAVCLANTSGGEIFLGVEDDGTVTGLHREHENVTGIAALIANRTSPPLTVRAQRITVGGVNVAHIEVPRSERLVATTDGTLQRRRIQADGEPICIPMLPGEFASRESDLRRLDYSALPVAGSNLSDLDPVERDRLRRAIERYKGDRSLLDLEDDELDGALGLVTSEGGRRVPTVTGLLLIGTERAIRQHLPTHEVAFQVLKGEAVQVNEFYHLPLLHLFERLEYHFAARTVEREIQVGLFRVGVPNVDRRAWREAVINALAHRDYTRLGAVHVRFQDDELVISNPGGFVDGVTPGNILVVEPKPRNPTLADALKRIGLAERTGRGVDLIYRGLLGYGRRAPNYGRSDSNGVVLEMSCAEADLGFVEFVVSEEEGGAAPLPVNTLLVLDQLRQQRRIDARTVADAIQRDVDTARSTMERLVDAGFVTAHGVKKGRTYTMSPRVYRALGQPEGYVRQSGYDRIQQEEMVKRYVREHGSIRRRNVMELCGLSGDQASRLLRQLAEAEVLTRRGQRRGAYYVPGPKL